MAPQGVQRAGMLVLSYLGFLGVLPLILEKRESEVRWHAKNGLLLFGTVTAVGIAAALVGALFPSLSCLYVLLMFSVGSVYVVVAILAVVKALQGERLMVPGISHYADRI